MEKLNVGPGIVWFSVVSLLHKIFVIIFHIKKKYSCFTNEAMSRKLNKTQKWNKRLQCMYSVETSWSIRSVAVITIKALATETTAIISTAITVLSTIHAIFTTAAIVTTCTLAAIISTAVMGNVLLSSCCSRSGFVWWFLCRCSSNWRLLKFLMNSLWRWCSQDKIEKEKGQQVPGNIH